MQAARSVHMLRELEKLHVAPLTTTVQDILTEREIESTK